MPSIDRIARTINGPNEVGTLSLAKLEELQDIRWGQLKAQEQIALRRTAGFVLALFETQPDGFVITNAEDTKCRTIDNSSQYVRPSSHHVVMWTDSIDDAIQFARRKDAELFCEDDDDAWHIRKVSDVLAMWAEKAREPLSQNPSNGGPDQSGHAERVVAGGGGVTPPHPAPMGVDRRSVHHLLQLFRQFVTRNVTQWEMGAGDHHHPIWQDVAVELDSQDLNYDACNGPDWAFTEPMNRKLHQALVEEYTDMMNERAATEKGG